MKCPYHERINEAIAQRSSPSYCTGYPAYGIMLPSVMEEKRYCLRDRAYLECPIFLFGKTIDKGCDKGQMELCFPLFYKNEWVFS